MPSAVTVAELGHVDLPEATWIGGWLSIVYAVMQFLCGPLAGNLGDRFGRQGRAQLAAVMRARAAGIEVTPVWNKSNREHQIIGTTPAVESVMRRRLSAMPWSSITIFSAVTTLSKL